MTYIPGPAHRAPPMPLEDLKAELLRHRLASYHRTRGGWPIALAGAIYWAVLAVLGTQLPFEAWRMAALWGGGLLIPLAWLIARIARNPVFTDKTAHGSVTVAAFVSLWLVLVMLFAVEAEAPRSFPLIYAVVVSVHWPAIGWGYGKTGLYSAQAVIRVLLISAAFVLLPDHRTVLIPAIVAATYLGVIAVMLWQTRDRSEDDPSAPARAPAGAASSG